MIQASIPRRMATPYPEQLSSSTSVETVPRTDVPSSHPRRSSADPKPASSTRRSPGLPASLPSSSSLDPVDDDDDEDDADDGGDESSLMTKMIME